MRTKTGTVLLVGLILMLSVLTGNGVVACWNTHRLTVDGAVTRATSATRVFVSPALEPGRDYSYTLRAEIVRDGQTMAATERITVRAGQETRVSLTPGQFATASVAQK